MNLCCLSIVVVFARIKVEEVKVASEIVTSFGAVGCWSQDAHLSGSRTSNQKKGDHLKARRSRLLCVACLSGARSALYLSFCGKATFLAIGC
jgi:hypothetical protein